jgi:hypothetical protein
MNRSFADSVLDSLGFCTALFLGYVIMAALGGPNVFELGSSVSVWLAKTAGFNCPTCPEAANVRHNRAAVKKD